MKYLCVDYGTQHIGTAVSNDEGTIAFPRAVIANNEQSISRIITTVKEEGIGAIVIGDTRTFSGAENSITPAAESFAQELSARSGVPVELAQEAWSSQEAARFAPAGVKNDAAEAAVILQRFLEMRGA